MFAMLESKLGFGSASNYAASASASCCRSGAESDFHVNQEAPTVLSYSQMLRMSIEESMEGGADMGCYTQECVLRSNGGYSYARGEADMGSSECVQRYHNQRGRNMNRAGKEGLQNEEGFEENDYDLTCLTLGRCPASSLALPSSSPPLQAVTRPASSSGFTRTCKLCGTSKTPLWRSGPMGAKSLCNACGIRSNKAKKLSAAAVVLSEEEERPGDAGSWGGKWKGLSTQAVSTNKVMKRKKAEPDLARKMKKKRESKLGDIDSNQFAKDEKQRSACISKQQQQQQLGKVPCLHVNIVTSSPVKTESSSCVTSPGTPSPCSDRRRPFPPMSMRLPTQVPGHACLDINMCHFDHDCVFSKDEEQAAFLLMALSCGLVLA